MGNCDGTTGDALDDTEIGAPRILGASEGTLVGALDRDVGSNEILGVSLGALLGNQDGTSVGFGVVGATRISIAVIMGFSASPLTKVIAS
jgi:hypothetical protein